MFTLSLFTLLFTFCCLFTVADYLFLLFFSLSRENREKHTVKIMAQTWPTELILSLISSNCSHRRARKNKSKPAFFYAFLIWKLNP